jgi:hypothetical protein
MRSKPTIPQLIMWKIDVAHGHEHGYHDSLNSMEVAQLYPQVGDSITHRWLRVSILPNIHFIRCTARRSPQSLSQCFPASKIFILKFHCCRSHILQWSLLVIGLGDKLTPSPKSRMSHPVLMPRITTKLGKQHVTQISLLISALWLHCSHGYTFHEPVLRIPSRHYHNQMIHNKYLCIPTPSSTSSYLDPVGSQVQQKC